MSASSRSSLTRKTRADIDSQVNTLVSFTGHDDASSNDDTLFTLFEPSLDLDMNVHTLKILI